MPTTTTFGLRYPASTDPDNPPQDFAFLAADTDAKLGRAFPCTSGTRPTGLAAGDRGFLIHEGDTGKVLVWDGAAWATPTNFTGGSGGGGGTVGSLSTVSATYAATSTQSIATGTDVVIAFGVEQAADSAVTRSVQGAGHKFTLGQTRLWTITATVRFEQNATGGRVFDLRTGTGTILAKASGPPDTNAPFTANLSVCRRLPSGTTVMAVARHNATSSVALEPDGGNTVHIDVAGV